jgi:hypothetical protein
MTANKVLTHEAIDHDTFRRCACPARQKLRWESPRRRMYSCDECDIWWEELKSVLDDLTAVSNEPGNEEPANTNVG